jgi:hypothetical protein
VPSRRLNTETAAPGRACVPVEWGCTTQAARWRLAAPCHRARPAHARRPLRAIGEHAGARSFVTTKNSRRQKYGSSRMRSGFAAAAVSASRSSAGMSCHSPSAAGQIGVGGTLSGTPSPRGAAGWLRAGTTLSYVVDRGGCGQPTWSDRSTAEPLEPASVWNRNGRIHSAEVARMPRCSGRRCRWTPCLDHVEARRNLRRRRGRPRGAVPNRAEPRRLCRVRGGPDVGRGRRCTPVGDRGSVAGAALLHRHISSRRDRTRHQRRCRIEARHGDGAGARYPLRWPHALCSNPEGWDARAALRA